MADTKTKKVKKIFRKVKAPRSWANGQWQFAGVPPLRFNEKAEAEVLTSVDGEDVTVAIAGPDGIEDVPILDFIDARFGDLDVTKATRTEEVEVPDEAD